MGIEMLQSSNRALAAPAAQDGERGSMLIEVIIGGVLLAILAVGLFGAFDGSARVSARNKERATAARLAQEDQERLRGLPVTEISNLRESSPMTIEGVAYTVASRADWVADAAGTTSCAAGDAQADYLQIRSTVTANKPGAAKPVVVNSMLTPPVGTYGEGTGSLALEVKDRDDNGVADLPVTLTGPVTDDDVTNADGCAFFGYEPTGSYNATYSRAGWVDWEGDNAITESTSIASASVSTKSLRYDLAGSATVTFDTSESGTVKNANYDAVRLIHSNATRTLDTNVDASSVTLAGLFPFKDAYAAYAGECAANDPAAYGTPANTPVAALVDRGSNVPVKVRLPTITIRVRKSGSSPAAYLADHRVRFTSPCGAAVGGIREAITDAGGYARAALPYGAFGVCVDSSRQTTNTAQWRRVATTVANTAPAGTPETIVDLVVSTTGGSSANKCA